MAEAKHVKPVGNELFEKRERIYPNLRFPVATGQAVFFFAPTRGYIEAYHGDIWIFRHKDEPYYSMFNGGTIKPHEGLAVNQEVEAGDIIGTAEGHLYWRIGAVGNKDDWMDPDQWLKDNFEVWGRGVMPGKKKTDWGKIAFYGGVAYVLLSSGK